MNIDDQVAFFKLSFKSKQLKSLHSLHLNFSPDPGPSLFLHSIKHLRKSISAINLSSLSRYSKNNILKRLFHTNLVKLKFDITEINLKWMPYCLKKLTYLYIDFPTITFKQFYDPLFYIIKQLYKNKFGNKVLVKTRGLRYDKNFSSKFINASIRNKRKVIFIMNIYMLYLDAVSEFRALKDSLSLICEFPFLNDSFFANADLGQISSLRLEPSELRNPAKDLEYFSSISLLTNLVNLKIILKSGDTKSLFDKIRLPKTIKFLDIDLNDLSQEKYKFHYELEEIIGNNGRKSRACNLIDKQPHFMSLIHEIENLPNLLDLKLTIASQSSRHHIYILFFYALTKRLKLLDSLHIGLRYSDLYSHSLILCDFNVPVMFELAPKLREAKRLLLYMPLISYQGCEPAGPEFCIEEFETRGDLYTQKESLVGSIHFFCRLSLSKIRVLKGFPLISAVCLDIIAHKRSFLRAQTLQLSANRMADGDEAQILKLVNGLQRKIYLTCFDLEAGYMTYGPDFPEQITAACQRCSHIKLFNLKVGNFHMNSFW